MFRNSILTTTVINIVLMTNAWGELTFNNLKDKMALELLKLLPNRNVVASSLMVRFPLCKLASIATGDAKTELMTSLGFTNDTWMFGCYARFRDLITAVKKVDLTCINNIYVNYTDGIDPTFIKYSEYNFGVPVEKVGFSYPGRSVQFINRLISTATYRRITDVVDSKDIDRNTSMIIVNAIYYKGTWEFPFNYKLTKQEVFHHTDAKVSKVPMMNKVDSIPYVDAGEFQAVTIKFGTEGTSITFVLPFDKQGLPDILNKAYDDPNYFKPFLELMQFKTVKLKIPRFKIKTYVDWTGFLEEIGLYAIFNCSSSGLLGILKEEWRYNHTICLNKVKQKVFIEIDEMGVGRHILRNSRESYWDQMAPSDATLINSIDLTFDKPFLFTINFEFTQTNRHDLLIGVFYGPE